MTIKEATIFDVREGINKDNKLAVWMNLKSDRIDSLSFILENPTDVKRLEKLMSYTETRYIKTLEGKQIFKLGSGLCFGFGIKEQDKFVPLFIEEFMEVSVKEFEELLL